MKKYIVFISFFLQTNQGFTQNQQQVFHYQIENEHVFDLNTDLHFRSYEFYEKISGGKILLTSVSAPSNKIMINLNEFYPAFILGKDGDKKSWIFYLEDKEFTLKNINAEKRATGTEISWQATVKDINSTKLEILRSFDGINYSVIGTVNTQCGTLKKYTFWDDTKAHIKYYQLRVVDSEKKYSYTSKVMMVLDEKQLYLYPTIAKDNIIVSIPATASGIVYEIVNNTGQLIKKGILDNEASVIPIVSYPNGTYYFIAMMSDGTIIFNGKFIKNE